MSWVVAGITVASSLLASSETDDSWKASAAQAGKDKAQTAASRSRANAMLPAKAKAVNDQALAASVQSESTKTAQVASATVAAAVAGATGGNVTQTTQSLEGTAARVQDSIAKRRTQGLLQINQEYDDLLWQAESKQYDVTVGKGASVGRKLLTAGLSGLGAGISAKRQAAK